MTTGGIWVCVLYALALVLLALDRDDGARVQLVHALDGRLAFALAALQRAAHDVAANGYGQ